MARQVRTSQQVLQHPSGCTLSSAIGAMLQLCICDILDCWCSHKQALSKSVTQYFHSDGYLDEASFAQDVQQLLKTIQAKSLSKAH